MTFGLRGNGVGSGGCSNDGSGGSGIGEPGVELEDFDFRLVAGAPQIDAGAVLPNINDPFVPDGMPDIGALEYGQPKPAYGPRPVGDANLDFALDAEDLSAVRNVLGEAAQFVNPEKVFDISRGIRQVLLDDGLRQQLIERGYQQVKRFSWQASVRRVLEVYREVAAA